MAVNVNKYNKSFINLDEIISKFIILMFNFYDERVKKVSANVKLFEKCSFDKIKIKRSKNHSETTALINLYDYHISIIYRLF